jgi:DNA-binding transcriptional ArsR family regulator
MLRLVWDRERAASELAEAAQLSRPAASQHLKQLREGGLVTVRVAANRTRSGTAGGVQLRLGTCRGRDPSRLDDRRDRPDPDGRRRYVLRLVQRGLDAPAADAHRAGWQHYLARLQTLAAGVPPGPDPLAAQRVPTPAERRSR